MSKQRRRPRIKPQREESEMEESMLEFSASSVPPAPTPISFPFSKLPEKEQQEQNALAKQKEYFTFVISDYAQQKNRKSSNLISFPTREVKAWCRRIRDSEFGRKKPLSETNVSKNMKNRPRLELDLSLFETGPGCSNSPSKPKRSQPQIRKNKTGHHTQQSKNKNWDLDSIQTHQEIDSSDPLFEPLRQILTKSDILRRQTRLSGINVVHIGVRKPERNKGTVGKNFKFYLGYENGTSHFVDFNDCFGEETNITLTDLIADVHDAFQQAIRNHYNQTKKNYWDRVKGMKLSVAPEIIQNSSVNYKAPWTFQTILQDFMTKYSINYLQLIDKIEYQGSRKKKIADECLLNNWKSFHKEFPLDVFLLESDYPIVEKLLRQVEPQNQSMSASSSSSSSTLSS